MKCISPLFSSMRGKIGGAVASRARGAAITLRALAIPANPNTLLQGAARGTIISLSARWKSTLTELQQQAWWDSAGDSGTGKGLFTKINQPRAYAARFIGDSLRFKDATVTAVSDVNIFDDAPPSLNYSGVINPTYVIDDSANTIVPTIPLPQQTDFCGAAISAQPSLMSLYVTPGQFASRFSRQFPFQLVGVYGWGSEVPTAAALPAINLANLGIPTIAGRVMYVRAVFSNSEGGIVATGESRVTITA